MLVSLLAEVALNYIELRSFQRQLVVAKENLKVQTDTLHACQSLDQSTSADTWSVAL